MDRADLLSSSTERRAVRRGKRLMEDETRLHERLLARDRSALLECVDRFGRIVYCTSLAESGDSLAAETLTERAFVELWRRPEAFDPRRAPIVLQLVRLLRTEYASKAVATIHAHSGRYLVIGGDIDVKEGVRGAAG